MNEDLLKIMHITANYYATLCNHGIPEKLAVRIVGDLSASIVLKRRYEQ